MISPRTLPKLRLRRLIFLAFIPQTLLFILPATRPSFPVALAALTLVISQIMLLTFAWANRRLSGMWLMGLGLVLNFLVIVANGGLMPISPETVQIIAPQAVPGSWAIGQRLGYTKDIVLPLAQTHLWPLSDCLTLPTWIPYRLAFSIGDILIICGVGWTLWHAAFKTKSTSLSGEKDEPR
jgi:hypothetical protein